MFDIQANALADKVILVTGAGDGIGKTAALTYAKHGAKVILLGKTLNKLESTYDDIISQGWPEPLLMPLDMQGATENDYTSMAEAINNECGQLNGLLHNASILGSLSPIEHTALNVFQDVLQINLTAQFMMTKALLPLMRSSNLSSIIFTSSSVGRQGRAFWGAYAISKFATEGIMQVLADECDGTSVRVNSINPGATRTKMRASAYPAEDPQKLKSPEQIMPLYLYLMSDTSVKENGQQFNAQ